MAEQQGHLFRFTVTSQGRYQGPDGKFSDADWEGDPWTLEVRAWSLVEALRTAADLGMNAWDMGDD